MKKIIVSLLAVLAVFFNLSIYAYANEESAITVTTDNYIEADVDVSFAHIFRAVGANKFRHDRDLIPLDKQPAVAMNRDTVYSFGIFYAPKGTTITLPKTKDNRYQSAMILQADHYIDQVFYGAGRYEIESQTEFVSIVIRTQVDPTNPNDIKYVNRLQDQIKVTFPKGVKVKEYQPRSWDLESLNKIRAQYQAKAAKLPNLNETSGAHGTLDPEKQKMGVSVGLGLLPPQDAMYINRSYGLSKNVCYKATYDEPGYNDLGFFSFTMYGEDKYLHEGINNLNDRTIKKNEDGTFTLYFGSKELCGDVDNLLDTPSDNWNLVVRVYLPKEDVIDGTYKLPIPVSVK